MNPCLHGRGRNRWHGPAYHCGLVMHRLAGAVGSLLLKAWLLQNEVGKLLSEAVVHQEVHHRWR